jgi:hypothetical protein
LRRYLITATAAVAALAIAAPVASAQEPKPTMSVNITPKKAGTKKKPKNSTIKLSIENPETNRTMTKLTITTAKTFKFSGKGLTRCDEAELEAGGPAACPRASRVGSGTASAALGVNSSNPTPLTFDVTAIVLGAKEIGFYLAARELPVNVLAPGHISGRKLTIEVPEAAQQPATNVFAGLISLNATLKAKKGKNYLASTNGCKARKHPFSAVLTFRDNGVSPAGTRTTNTANAGCKK